MTSETMRQLLCAVFGHRWNLHSIPLHHVMVGEVEWVGVENRHCRRCGAPGPEITVHRVTP